MVFTKYEDVKEIFNMDETSGRPSSAPGHKFRPGWETVAKVEPEMNKNRPPGVLLSNVRVINISLICGKPSVNFRTFFSFFS